ncbi:hypothetical protein [Bufonid herpesvirus 1]|uniref:hypothetical protein n=1 Tax=Bufonid herpesvirus 1 TaxID=2282206 RepID=UPI000EB7750F|nr:hypothetical protein [Bufonid herpesvirus 1]AXF48582.1 hypothetical protein [Bufonid herpesvirus 1]
MCMKSFLDLFRNSLWAATNRFGPSSTSLRVIASELLKQIGLLQALKVCTTAANWNVLANTTISFSWFESETCKGLSWRHFMVCLNSLVWMSKRSSLGTKSCLFIGQAPSKIANTDFVKVTSKPSKYDTVKKNFIDVLLPTRTLTSSRLGTKRGFTNLWFTSGGNPRSMFISHRPSEMSKHKSRPISFKRAIKKRHALSSSCGPRKSFPLRYNRSSSESSDGISKR